MLFNVALTDHKVAGYTTKGMGLQFLQIQVIFLPLNVQTGTMVAQWLRCCATNRKVVGLIRDGVIGIFH